MAGSPPRREQTLAVVFGASKWPNHPELDAFEAFDQSAKDVTSYLRNPHGLDLPEKNVLVKFDSPEDAQMILGDIRKFLRERRTDLKMQETPVMDLLFYYVGHGGIKSGRFFFTIGNTNKEDPRNSSITDESFSDLVLKEAQGWRNYLILDCCFAAALTQTLMSTTLAVVEQNLLGHLPSWKNLNGEDVEMPEQGTEMPEQGTALLCAAGPRQGAVVQQGQTHTMFTGALLEVLRRGDPTAPPGLSLDAVRTLVRNHLDTRFKNEAVLPQVHTPLQKNGRVDSVRLFRNPARPMVRGSMSDHADEELRADLARLTQLKSTYQSNPSAQNKLGCFHEQGRAELRKDDGEALEHYHSAAQKSSISAMYNLGRFHEQGRGGLVPNKDKAIRCYQRAAETEDDLRYELEGLRQELRETRRKLDDAEKRSPSFSIRDSIEMSSLADFEEKLEHGSAVMVILHQIQPLDHNDPLYGAVFNNFMQGIKYTFLISESQHQHCVNEYRNRYGLIFSSAKTALKKAGKLPDKGYSFDDVFSTIKLPDDWKSGPYVFYRLPPTHGRVSVRGFRGVKNMSGISEKYVPLPQAGAAAFCAAVRLVARHEDYERHFDKLWDQCDTFDEPDMSPPDSRRESPK